MDRYEDMMELFAEKHPVCFWLTVRLGICFGWMFVVILGLLALYVLAAPFFGKSLLVWLLVPMLITGCWAFGFWAVWLFKNFVESW